MGYNKLAFHERYANVINIETVDISPTTSLGPSVTAMGTLPFLYLQSGQADKSGTLEEEAPDEVSGMSLREETHLCVIHAAAY